MSVPGITAARGLWLRIPPGLRWRIDPRPWLTALRLGSGWRSVRALRGLELERRREWLRSRSSADRSQARGRPAVRVGIRSLGGRKMLLRPGTSDVAVAGEVLIERLHLPRGDIDGPVRAILDLGSNIGLSIADMAERFPEARILGVELDGDNARVAEQNLEPWQSRCRLIHAGVWPHPGEVRYVRETARESGNRIVADGADDALSSAPAISMDALLDSIAGGAGELVDFVKMDIEGSEAHVLTENTGWAGRVRMMLVEVHDPYGLNRCIEDLRGLGFDARQETGSTVVASRAPAREPVASASAR